MSLVLKRNTTLTCLNLNGKKQKEKEIISMNDNKTGNKIGAEGAESISKALKNNTTLEELNLSSDD